MKPSQFLQKLKSLDTVRLTEIKGVGEKLAQNIVEFAQSNYANRLLTKFIKLEEQNKAPELVETQRKTGEKGVVCMTGTFRTPRSEIQSLLEKKGYKVVSTVTKETTILLVGADAGSKLEKAEALGIKIVRDYNEL